MGDMIVITVLAAVVGMAVRSLIKDHKKGGCAGCSGCKNAANCPSRMAREKN
ncbi:MAG: FeoB-associated Cys-rich membrane protein [Clostridia bacterium]|nr:FeoB-associated Cys-rich membrane protein [Clostridia bacterium]MBQ2326022.1 FeoB-associated Cys-rich membrane protein [Clostridia bacterium]MBQ5813551.1 FeoB-associated Cys-rich membrane protein [Clostridia bacterium]